MKLIIITLTFLLSAICRAQVPVLLKDIHPNGDSFGEYYIAFNGLTFFAASDGVHGQELWVSDGTNAGTQMVKDIRTGQFDSYIRDFIVFNNKLFFIANDNVNGEEIWTTDGTAANTQMLSNYNLAVNPSNISFIGIANNKLFFSIDFNTTGVELHCTDGTAAGTIALGDLNPGNADSDPSQGVTLNGKLYFNAKVNMTDTQLFQSDGTLAGTLPFDLYAGTPYAGNVLLGSGEKTVFNGRMYISAGTPATGHEIWSSDGTTTGSFLLKDIIPGPTGGGVGYFKEFNQELYFAANDSVHGQELWKTDGTLAGTQMVKDINPGVPSSLVQYPTVFNNKLFFSARTNATGTEPWISDGTANGTQMIADIVVGVNNSDPESPVVLGNKVYFTANSTLSSNFDYQLYETNGTIGNMNLLLPAGATITANTVGFLNSFGVASRFVYVCNNKVFVTARFSNQQLETYTITPSSADLENIGTSPFAVFPNPTNDKITLQGIESGAPVHYRITNIAGQTIRQGTLTLNDPIIDLQDLPQGTYFLHPNEESILIPLVKI